MTTQISLKEIPGRRVKGNPFLGFSEKKMLVEYDGPLLVLAEDKEGQSWLFKWCATTEDPAITRWIAVKLSEETLHSLEAGTLSLRDVIYLADDGLYIFDAKELFDPIEIRRSMPEKLPINYLPSGSWSIHGNSLQPKFIEKERLTISVNVSSKYISSGRAPSTIVSGLQDRLQDFIRRSAHAINKTPQRKIPDSLEDWATLQLASVAAGSFKMEWLTNSDFEKSEKLSAACEVLARFSKGDFVISEIKEQIGEEAIFLACLLADFISKAHLSLSISWLSESIPGGYLAIDKRRADNFLNAVGYRKKTGDEESIITLKLTAEEAGPLRLPVRGTGGHQSLIKGLQAKLKKDNSIELTASEVERIVRYGLNYGGGGFQNRLLGLAKALKHVDASLQTSFARTRTRKTKTKEPKSHRLDEY